MTCSGTCTLCGKPRDRGGCRCFDRGGRQVDDIHGALLVADEYIRTERKFNREKHEIALALIGEAVCDIRREVAARRLDGRELMRVEKSAVVLKRKADGKLWATLSNNNDCPKHAAFNRDCKICREGIPLMSVTITGTITTKDELNAAISAMVALTDFTNIAKMQEHFEKVNGEKTSNVTGVYLTAQTRLPGQHAATFAGEQFFTKHVAFKIDLFNLSDSEYATEPTTTPAMAATIDLADIKAKIAAGARLRATKLAEAKSPTR
ncbi:unnamed protein product [Sphagnum jensenii]